MKPIALTIEAFGPYRGSIALDFTELRNQTMFLISGPTGAGKTSILDAMVYALYGEPSGEDRKVESIRSDFADPTTLTRVEFTFSIGDVMYRIERLPKQEVAKKRGTGMKVQGARATVSEYRDGEWHVIATSAADVRDTVHRIIGFRRDQFLQVVLLPQGEFRKLLVASTGEREELLHTLFRTDIYRNLQEQLKEEFDSVQQGIEDMLKEQDALLQSVHTDDETVMLTIEDVKTYLLSLQGEREKLDEERRVMTETLETYDAMRRSARLYDDTLRDVERQKERLLELQKEGEHLVPVRTLVARLYMLNDAFSLYKDMTSREEQVQGLLKDIAGRRHDLDVMSRELNQCESEYKALADMTAEQEEKRIHLVQWREQGLYWEQLKEMTGRLTAERLSVEELKRRFAATEADLKDRERQAAITDIKLNNIDSFVSGYVRAASEHAELKERLRHVKQNMDMYVAYRAACKKEAELTGQLEIYKADADALKIGVERLELLTRNGRAYELGLNLTDGEPCPVCGALSHPDVAIKPALFPTQKELEEARRKMTDGERLVFQTEGVVSAQKDEVRKQADALHKNCPDFLETADFENCLLRQQHEIQQQYDAAAHLILAMEQAEEVQRRLNGQRRDLEKVMEEDRALLQTDTAELHGKELSLSNLEGQIDRLKHSITGDISDDWKIKAETWQKELTEFDDRMEKAKRKADFVAQRVFSATAQLKLVEEQRSTVAEQAEALSKSFQHELVNSDSDVSEFQNIVKEFDRLKEYETSIQTFDVQVKEVNAVLDASRTRLKELTVPEERIDDERYEAAANARDEAVGRLAARDQQLHTVEHILSRLTDLDASAKEARSRFEFIRRLYELANGGTEGLKNLTFERYVLGIILDEVVYASNIRLQKMSRYRYSLERSDYTGTGRGKQGLDLAVMDSYTGQARPANTLSGGETFLASMALALGLADVIQSYAGGIHMDTIFIDEGFGTLDPDTLELAMETLVQLQHSGRLIGLISHVPELKSRIAAHLEIARSDAGSTAKFVVDGA